MRLILVLLCTLGIVAHAGAAGPLLVERAWIRTPPPGAVMLAGYATLRNTGTTPLVITGASSDAFGDASLHLSHVADGLVRMEPIQRIEIQPGSYAVLDPGSYHLMLMRPKRELAPGTTVQIHISTATGEGASASFEVRDSAP